MEDPFLEGVRETVREVLAEEGRFDLVEMRLAFDECKSRLDEAILEMKRSQQMAEVWRSLAQAYKREIQLLKEKYNDE